MLARVREGDRGALDLLLARHAPHVRRIVGMRLDARVRRRVSVSDVVQAAHLDVVQGLDDYLAGEPLPFRWWLRKTVHERLRRVHREHVGAGKRAVAREVRLSDRSSLQLGARLAIEHTTPSQQAAKRELARRVREALAELPEVDREILLLRTYEDLPYGEVAYVLGITPTAARMRYGRALVKLGAILRHGGIAEEPE